MLKAFSLSIISLSFSDGKCDFWHADRISVSEDRKAYDEARGSVAVCDNGLLSAGNRVYQFLCEYGFHRGVFYRLDPAVLVQGSAEWLERKALRGAWSGAFGLCAFLLQCLRVWPVHRFLFPLA